MAIKISLTSGDTYEFEKVGLYPNHLVSQVAVLRQQAATKLGGYSSGLGFWGSPGWVIGGALVLGALESVASQGMQSEALALLRKAAKLLEDLQEQRAFFMTVDIRNISEPCPEKWLAQTPAKKKHDLSALQLNYFERKQWLKARSLTEADVVNNTVTIEETAQYVIGDSDFFFFMSKSREVAIRWSTVCSYETWLI